MSALLYNEKKAGKLVSRLKKAVPRPSPQKTSSAPRTCPCSISPTRRSKPITKKSLGTKSYLRSFSSGTTPPLRPSSPTATIAFAPPTRSTKTPRSHAKSSSRFPAFCSTAILSVGPTGILPVDLPVSSHYGEAQPAHRDGNSTFAIQPFGLHLAPCSWLRAPCSSPFSFSPSPSTSYFPPAFQLSTASAVSTISTASEARIIPITRTRTAAPCCPMTRKMISEKRRKM